MQSWTAARRSLLCQQTSSIRCSTSSVTLTRTATGYARCAPYPLPWELPCPPTHRALDGFRNACALPKPCTRKICTTTCPCSCPCLCPCACLCACLPPCTRACGRLFSAPMCLVTQRIWWPISAERRSRSCRRSNLSSGRVRQHRKLSYRRSYTSPRWKLRTTQRWQNYLPPTLRHWRISVAGWVFPTDRQRTHR